MQIYGGIFAMQLYWNHTSAWMISSKFAAFLQNTFCEEYLWRAASGNLNYNKKRAVSCFLSLSSVIIHQSTPIQRVSPLLPSFPPPVPRISTLIPRIPTLIPIIPTLISIIATLIPRIPTLIPIIPRLDFRH